MTAPTEPIKPPRLRPGDRIAIVSPSSPIEREELQRGASEMRALGFEPVWDDAVLARDGYVAGAAAQRAQSFLRAWQDPSVAALMASRGGYGSAQILPWLEREVLRATPKLFIGYSDPTAVLSWLTTGCGLTALHGPMIDRRIAAGAAGVDVDSFRAAVEGRGAGRMLDPGGVEVLQAGEAVGALFGGTLAILCASLGTPFAFEPPEGSILFVEDVNERPFRLDRMFTQLRLAGVFRRVAAVVVGEMPGCDDQGGASARDVVRRSLEGFHGPIVMGFPSGHTTGALWTLPLGVRVRVRTDAGAGVLVEEEAVA